MGRHRFHSINPRAEKAVTCPNDQYCGQNLPDSPTWQFLTPGWKTTVTVSGFQVFRLPCDVTGFRAMWHMRNSGNLTPPSATETIADISFSTTLHLVRCRLDRSTPRQ